MRREQLPFVRPLVWPQTVDIDPHLEKPRTEDNDPQRVREGQLHHMEVPVEPEPRQEQRHHVEHEVLEVDVVGRGPEVP